MSKENNLTDFLTDVASAIKDKRGIGSVNAQNFSTEIRAIEPLLDTLDITDNGTYNVKDYKNVYVEVSNDYLEMIKALVGKYGNTKIIVPEGVTYIADSAFYRKEGFNQIVSDLYLPKTLTEIGYYNMSTTCYYSGTFEEWLKIKKCGVTGGEIYGTATSPLNYFYYKNPENNAYVNVKNTIIDYTIPNDFSELPQGALSSLVFKGGGVIYLNSNIKTIGMGCFYMTRGINEIRFEDNMELDLTSKDYLFSSSDLKKLYLPITETLPYSMCNDCYNLQEINIKEGTSTIKAHCFKGCTALKQLIIPKSVEDIGAEAFYNMTGNVVMESSTPCTITSSTFSKFKGNIYVPKGSRETYISATNWSAQASKTYEKYVVVFNIPSALLNNEAITYSIDGGKTYQQFTNAVLSLPEVATIKIKSTDSSQTILIGTTSGGNDVGTISNSELTFSFTTDTNVYLTIQ